MALTRANAEFMIVADLSGLLSAADMTITVVGSNANLNRPIGRALAYLGYSVTDITSVADADVAQVTDAKTAEFCDLLILYTMETILGWLDDVDLTVGPRTEKLSQLTTQVERKLASLSKRMQLLYGYGLSTPETGYITRYFAEHGDE